MLQYIFRRLLLVIPTLFGIMLTNFIIIQAAPGGPIQQIISKMRGGGHDVETRIGGASTELFESSLDHSASPTSQYRGAEGVDPAFIKELEKMFGFDKPTHERFFKMIWDYARFDLGKSYFHDATVIDIIKSKLPVSISLGLWTTLIIYLVSIPLGIKKAVRDGTPFDVWTSTFIVIGYAIPSFLLALLLIILFAGGSFFSIFPLRGIVSEHWETLSMMDKITDYIWHMTLPVFTMVIWGFAKLTLLTKNSFLDEINKQYVLTAKAKGLTEKKVMYGHIFRNAMLLVIAGFPSAFVAILFTSSVLIEVLFSLDGLGLLGFESALNRNYPVMFGTLYVFTILGMVLHLIGDLMYMFVDKRIDLSASRG